MHEDKEKQSVCSKRVNEGGNSPALELVRNINTLVSFLGGPCVSKNFHYKSMLSDASIVYSIFYKHAYAYMSGFLHLFYKCVNFLHVGMGNHLFSPVLLKMF